MKTDYHLRQQKIYEDYVGYSTDSLKEMVNSRRYMDNVTDVLEDILIERNALPPTYKQEKVSLKATKDEPQNTKEQTITGLIAKQAEVNFFVKQLENSSDKELAEIITKYTLYQEASVEAALIIAERRGTITIAEKENLFTKTEEGFSEYNQREEVKAQKRGKKSSVQINSGIILLLIGGALTGWTKIHPVNGYSIIFYGFIFYGIVQLYKGFFMSNEDEK
jgi:hypothetical protein